MKYELRWLMYEFRLIFYSLSSLSIIVMSLYRKVNLMS